MVDAIFMTLVVNKNKRHPWSGVQPIFKKRGKDSYKIIEIIEINTGLFTMMATKS